MDPASDPLSTRPAPDEERRARDLSRMKLRATLLLVAAAAVFVVTRLATGGDGAWGYVESASEAAMVGGVADWFAVTAMFRHPLRLPIPHTAIIPRRKDQIGRALGDFVQHNFLDGETVTGRLREFGTGRRVGSWLSEPANTRRLADQTSVAIHGVGDVLGDEDVAAAIGHVLVERVDAVALTPAAGRVIELALEGGHDRAVLDSTLRGLDRLIEDNRQVLRDRLGRESPWWVPEAIDDRVFDKLMRGLHQLVAEVLADPHHPLRGHIRDRLASLADAMSEDPALLARGEVLKRDLLEHPEVRAWFNSVWAHLKEGLFGSLHDLASPLRGRMEHALVRLGENIESDPELAEKIDGWVESVVLYLIDQSGSEVADLIATTVERWDADTTSSRIEAQIGRDLQFIRINGTIVGGIVGVAIHAVAQLL